MINKKKLLFKKRPQFCFTSFCSLKLVAKSFVFKVQFFFQMVKIQYEGNYSNFVLWYLLLLVIWAKKKSQSVLDQRFIKIEQKCVNCWIHFWKKCFFFPFVTLDKLQHLKCFLLISFCWLIFKIRSGLKK